LEALAIVVTLAEEMWFVVNQPVGGVEYWIMRVNQATVSEVANEP